MRLLLDTHVALWAVAKTGALTEAVRNMIADPVNEVWVSAVSVWEIAIKHARGRGRPTDLGVSAAQALELFVGAGYALLDIKPGHAVAVETLPLIHGDPFDRLLVAQALTEPLRLITHDSTMERYSDAFVYF
ncbi:MAG: type II toxin-antitoxin system VapC family toxin [Caulobacteraceae bacterium]